MAKPGEAAKVDENLDRRLKEFAAAERTLPPQGAAAFRNPATEQAGEQPGPDQPKRNQPEELGDEKPTAEKDDKRSKLKEDAKDIAVDAIKSTGFKAALPYILSAALVVGIILAIIMGMSQYKKSLDNPSGPRQVDPVVAGQDTDEVSRLLALTGDEPATIELLDKRITEMKAEITRLRTLINSDIKDAALKQQALDQLQKIEDLITKKLLPALEDAKKEQAKSGGENTRTVGSKKKLPKKITDSLKELKKIVGDLQETLFKAAGSNGAKIAAIARAEEAKHPRENSGDNYPSYDNGKGKVAPYAFGDQWCANFVSWAYMKAGDPRLWNLVGHRNVENVWNYMAKNHIAWMPGRKNPKKLTPKPGDMAFYDSDSAKLHDGLNHIGLVVAVHSDGTIDAIDGNWGQAVTLKPNVRVGYGVHYGVWRLARMSN